MGCFESISTFLVNILYHFYKMYCGNSVPKDSSEQNSTSNLPSLHFLLSTTILTQIQPSLDGDILAHLFFKYNLY